MKRLILGLAAVVALVGVGRAEGEVLTVNPESDAWGEDTPIDGVFDMLQDTIKLATGGGIAEDYEHRLALEFDASEIPSESIIKSATLGLTAGAFGGPGVTPEWDFVLHGFVGDGTVELSDLTVSNPILPPITFDGETPTDLRADVTAFTQLLVDENNDHAGFMLAASSLPEIAFVITFFGNESLTPEDRPTLTIDYEAIPEPSTLALLAMGAFGLLAYGWRRRNIR